MVAFAFGMAIMVLAYTIGHHSGGQINCAVTLSLVLGGQVSCTKKSLHTILVCVLSFWLRRMDHDSKMVCRSLPCKGL